MNGERKILTQGVRRNSDNMDKHYYFTFISTYHAIKAEKILNNEKWEFKMVPVPRSISSSCGTALRCSPLDAEPVKALLLSAGVQIENSHELETSEIKGPITSFFKKNRNK